MKKVFLDALGCPKALVDAERMAYFLGTQSYTMVTTPEEADIIIVNTCGFIEEAKKESIETLLGYAELKKNNPDLEIVATGCLTERYKEKLLSLIPEIDHATGVKDPSLVLKTLSQSSYTDQTNYSDIRWKTERVLQFSGMAYAYLKISEGCNRQCGFCVIPSIRGSQRSRPIEDIVEEAYFLRDQGIEELILIAEDTSSYGLDLYKERSLTKLLPELTKIGFPWIRIMYLYPEPEVLRIVQMMKDLPGIVPYIDIPLQHASPHILESMKRGGSDGEFLTYIENIRNILPDISIRSTFILGYPGERDEDVEILARFLQKAELDRVGFFAYSDEEESYAHSLKPKIPKKKIKERIAYVANIQKSISEKRLSRFIGKTLTCINDGESRLVKGKPYRFLRTPYDAPEIDGGVYVPDNENLDTQVFHTVKIESVTSSYDLKGRIV
ncbi:30S ribosomal protein S12 methylthiotransferase RimO [Thermospira aquatica]|uniref:Ribosomal protein uS12 methylthiotransferase RimO n=1 Tax=Thermospira aquatica TaxID=2828656 RepID=A0AAX3BAS8_9SPIR|nr:30S ribosomal protein S12 methylthiotransferase RimO [Thermospira aquatica]URA09388.1 30S ribosomal protein S12 methylthiotransferase RimO [Thermospira aquatica]